MPVRKKLIAANWKMNGGLAANRLLVEAVREGLSAEGARLVLCVPYPYLAQVGELLRGSRIMLGAQNASEFDSGAYTGEVSCGMLADIGCSYVIVGHSERRAIFGETDSQVAAKAVKVLSAGLNPIVCVGETAAEREASQTMEVVGRQVDAVLEALPDDAFSALVVAYEPVWAVGTGRSASPADAQAVHARIRSLLGRRFGPGGMQVPILYGGSVNSGNAAALLAMPDIDGGLIGGASLVAGDFLAICEAGALVN